MTEVAIAAVDEKLKNNLKFQLELALSDHRSGFEKFVQAIKSVKLHEGEIKQIPFAIIPDVTDGDFNEFEVFPNIVVDISKIEEDGMILPRRIMRPTLETLETELACDRRSIRWVRSGVNTLRKKEKVNIARYLRRAFALQEAGRRDDEIRDLADRIAEFGGPARLVTCETPEQYVEMFTCNTGTCSMVHSTSHRTPTLDALAKQNRYSSEWFHYNPHTQGMYTIKNGVVLARTILLRKDITKPFKEFHHLNGISAEQRDLLGRRLRSMGMTPANYRLTITEHFEVPATEFNGQMLMPLPYHDSVNPDYYIGWDEEKKVFRCGPGNDKPKDIPCVVQPRYYNWGGWAPSNLKTTANFQ